MSVMRVSSLIFSLFFFWFLLSHLMLKELYVLSKICRPEEIQIKKYIYIYLVALYPNLDLKDLFQSVSGKKKMFNSEEW